MTFTILLIAYFSATTGKSDASLILLFLLINVGSLELGLTVDY